MHWQDLLARRAILVSGKGGVGKTTATAVLARRAAAAGRRVLCVELAADASAFSPVAQMLGSARCSEQPVVLAPMIRGVLVTPRAGFEGFFARVLPSRWMARAALRSKAIRGFLLSAPAIAETGALLCLLDLIRQRRSDGEPEFETIVVDLPATGHALALAQLPERLIKLLPSGPVHDAVVEGLAVLRDERQCGAALVSLSESLPVSEAIELATGLAGCRIPVAAAILNRVQRDPFSEEEREYARQLAHERGPLLGGAFVERIDREAVAGRRLGEALSTPVLRISERSETGPALVAALAEEIDRETALV